MPKNRVTPHRPRRDERKSKEVADLKRENHRLKRENGKLKDAALPRAPRKPKPEPVEPQSEPKETPRDSAGECPECGSKQTRRSDVGGRLFFICEECLYRKRLI